MQEHGLKISELVTLFNLEVLNRGSDYDTALLTITDVNRPGLQFHSFYDYFDPRRLQVLGKAEITYLKGLTTEQRRKCFDDLFLYDIPALVISRGLDCFPECLESARVHERTLLRTEETTVEFTSHTIEYLNRVLAPCVTRHGVLLDISGEGVMITGDSGIGKSESAIELIMRGHRLVADDAVEIRRISNQLIGTAPEVIRHYIELRGIGVIDVRQLFGMSAIMNGLALHGGFIPYAGTFMVFSDYAKNALRLAALMGTRAVWVFTHDSIGVGEDGPTHQPIEQVPGLRLMPGLDVWRPCDTVETAVAWQCALENAHRPTCLSLSRQNLPFVSRDEAQVQAIARGGYVLRDCDGTPELILMATGSEVGITLEAAEALTAEGRKVRVVSMPCCERFDAQDAAYRESVLPAAVRARVAVEAAAADYWRKYVGLDGAVLGMTTFGASGPGKALAEHFGFTSAHLADMARQLLG